MKDIPEDFDLSSYQTALTKRQLAVLEDIKHERHGKPEEVSHLDLIFSAAAAVVMDARSGERGAETVLKAAIGLIDAAMKVLK